MLEVAKMATTLEHEDQKNLILFPDISFRVVLKHREFC